MPTDSHAFMSEWKGKPIDGAYWNLLLSRLRAEFSLGIVEQVKDGSTLRVRLLMPEGDHQIVNITLAGVRSPRVAGKPEETSEPYGEEASGFA